MPCNVAGYMHWAFRVDDEQGEQGRRQHKEDIEMG